MHGGYFSMTSLLSRAATAAAAAICIVFGAGTAQATLPADVYAALPEMSDVTLSPDGTRAAMLQPGPSGAYGVTIYTLGTQGMPCVFAPTDVKISGVSWANSNRLLVSTSFVKTLTDLGEHRARLLTRQILINTQCKDPKIVLGELDQVHFSEGNTIVVGHPANSPDHLLVASMGSKETGSADSRRGTSVTGVLELYDVDPDTGRGKLVYSTPGGATGLLLDETMRPRVRYDENNANGDVVIMAQLAASDGWQEVYRYNGRDADRRSMDFAGFTKDPNVAYVMTRNGGDRMGAYEFNLQTKSIGRVVFESATAEVNGYVVDPYSLRVTGVQYTDVDGTRTKWFDQSWAQAYADVHATFPGATVGISSSSRDGKKMIVQVEGPEDPTTTFYFYDAVAPSISKVGSQYPRVTPAELAPRKTISYQSRDGFKVPAYLTLPPGSSGKNLPLVVMPHGGPAQHDEPGFDWWAQFVASRGFAVLQPQFRGSDGFGQKWEEMGHHEWGLKMQNDISDGVLYATAQGIADPKKVCIVGWSYGGYAALAGVTLTPELYKCGIAVAGVSNLITIIGEYANRGMALDPDTGYWPKLIGDPTRDVERLRATSPAMHADRVTASLLLIHGKNDTIVPIRQSEEMAAAMAKAGKPVEFVRIDGDDHHMYRASSRKQMLEAMDKFLQAQLK